MLKFKNIYLNFLRKFSPRKKLAGKYLLDALFKLNKVGTYLSMGDKVESTYGDQGSVILIFKDIKTNYPVGCAVRWDKEITPGCAISTFLPVLDLGKEFNPMLRKVL